ncbi:hypothetical protein [Persephonella sp. KM09-Lau-8]|uniref:hypothetical protein n=1 Tax=Persephonella sp. KM09-Lau-8 TaxID=1158345 RepID=UPI0004975434|nr:hypothetical protein [Persephonella sp. KM09-Lau-8]
MHYTGDIFNLFALDPQELRILFSMQSLLIKKDIEGDLSTIDKVKDIFGNDIKKKKVDWHKRWKKSVLDLLEKYSNKSVDLIEDLAEIKKLVDKKQQIKKSKLPEYLIALELITFVPYYPLHKNDEISASYNKDKDYLKILFHNLNIPYEYVDKLEDSYISNYKSLSGYWAKVAIFGLAGALIAAVTGGLAAPYIAGAIGASLGLSGAAAVSAGLATLGGGAIAAGGFGMAGGLTVLVGGGALLGGSIGTGIGALISSSSDFTLSQAAKLETIAKEIILGQQKDVRTIQEIVSELRKNEAQLKSELDKLRLENSKNKENIENLEKSIEYLEKLINHLVEEKNKRV